MPSMREWWQSQPESKAVPPAPIPPPTRKELIRRPVTPWETSALIALAGCTFPPGTAHKRFARDLKSAEKLTDAQREQLWRLVHRYRRQITLLIISEQEWKEQKRLIKIQKREIDRLKEMLSDHIAAVAHEEGF